jgi:hypothetical protein
MPGCDEYNILYDCLWDLRTCHSSLIQQAKWSSFTVFIYSARVFSSVSFVALSLRVFTNTMEFFMQHLWVHLSVLQCVVWHALEMLLHELSWSGGCFTIAEWFSRFHCTCTSFQIDIYVNYWHCHNYKGCLTKHTLSWTHQSLISQQWNKTSDSLCSQLQYIEMEHSPFPRDPMSNICNVVVIIWE